MIKDDFMPYIERGERLFTDPASLKVIRDRVERKLAPVITQSEKLRGSTEEAIRQKIRNDVDLALEYMKARAMYARKLDFDKEYSGIRRNGYSTGEGGGSSYLDLDRLLPHGWPRLLRKAG